MIEEVEKYVSNFELSKEMKELGFSQKTVWYWYLRGNCKIPEIVLGEASAMLSDVWKRICSAYLVGELGKILPDYICSYQDKGDWFCNPKFEEFTKTKLGTIADTEANVRSKMAICLKRKELI